MIYISVDLSIIFYPPPADNYFESYVATGTFFISVFLSYIILPRRLFQVTIFRLQENRNQFIFTQQVLIFFYMIYISVDYPLFFYLHPPDNYFESCVATRTFFISVFLSYIIPPPSIIPRKILAVLGQQRSVRNIIKVLQLYCSSVILKLYQLPLAEHLALLLVVRIVGSQLRLGTTGVLFGGVCHQNVC